MPTLPLDWDTITLQCSFVHCKTPKPMQVIIGKNTPAVVKPAKRQRRFGMIVASRPDADPWEPKWEFVDDEQLERFEKLVRSGQVGRVL